MAVNKYQEDTEDIHTGEDYSNLFDIEDDSDELEDEDVEVVRKSKKDDDEDEDEGEAEVDISELHPAEQAARLQKRAGTGSDQSILKDLRKDIFSIPLMKQDKVIEEFDKMDNILYPIVYEVVGNSKYIYEKLLQIVIKVAAGNTYGKNIYEKKSGKPKALKSRAVYKDDEMDFLLSSFILLRNYSKPNCDIIKKGMLESKFIRGVYEELLEEFIEVSKEYEELNWKALDYKLNNNTENYYKALKEIERINSKLNVNDYSTLYCLVRKASTSNQKRLDIRSKLIEPYLKKVYGEAKNTAKNTTQILENFQNGAIGLIKAVSNYDAKKASFSSAAKWWIKQMMLYSIKENANFIKLPVSTWQTHTTLEQIRDKFNIDEDAYDLIAEKAKMPVEKVKSIYSAVKISQVYSLNMTYDDAEKSSLEDLIPCPKSLEDKDSELNEVIRVYCKKADLNDRELKVLALQYGMVDIVDKSPKISEKEVLTQSIIQKVQKLGFKWTPDLEKLKKFSNT